MNELILKLCVYFFLPDNTFWDNKKVLNFFISIYLIESSCKYNCKFTCKFSVNLVDTLGVKGKKKPCTFLNDWKKQKKKPRKNGNLFEKPIFNKTNFVLWCNTKNNNCRYMQFSQIFYIIIFYTLYNFQYIMTLFKLIISMRQFQTISYFIIIIIIFFFYI